MTHSTGYLYTHPDAIASQTSKRNWAMSLLVSGEPVIPSRWMDPHARPNALDQNGLGACVAFAACTIWDAQEHKDWGRHLFVTGDYGTPDSGSPTGAFLAYRNLKRGFGSYPGDGIPNAEGSYPEQVWKMALSVGLPDKDGKRHKASAYYAQTITDRTSLDVVRRTIMAHGPVNIATPWADNWFKVPVGPQYTMPLPSSSIRYGHSYTCVGWETYGGVIYLTMQNSWGNWGSPMGLFRYPASWLYSSPLGPQVAWKTVDYKDAPTPPTPQPEGPMLALVDKTARTVDSTIGKQLWRADGTTPLVKLSSGVIKLASPAAYKNTAGTLFYSIVISSGGVPQLAWVKAADVSNITLVGRDPAADSAAHDAGYAEAKAKAAVAVNGI